MSEKITYLIIFISVYAFALLISGILALIYWKNHKNYRVSLKDFLSKYKEAKEIYGGLKQIKIKYELNPDEHCFFQNENVQCFQNKKTRYLKKILKDEYDDEIFLPKQNYSLFVKGIKNPDYSGRIYITNKRILIEDVNSNFQIAIDDIKKTNASIFNYDKDYYSGIYIFTKKIIFKIICNDLNISLILKDIKNKFYK